MTRFARRAGKVKQGGGLAARPYRGYPAGARAARPDSRVVTGATAVDGNSKLAIPRELAAIREVADILHRLGASPAARHTDMSHYLDGLKAAALRIVATRLPDRASRELAARYYCAGILAGVYGHESAIAHGIAGSLEQQVSGARYGRATRRIFASLMRAGRRQGRDFMAACGHVVRG